jgi:nitroreductase
MVCFRGSASKNEGGAPGEPIPKRTGRNPRTATSEQEQTSVNSPIVTRPSPTVSDALETRRSVRQFLPDPVSEEVVREILSEASRAASGGNLQPWHVYVLGGAARDEFVATVDGKRAETPFGDGPEYAVYPEGLGEPYNARRGRVAAQMYELLDIARDDRAARMAQMARNFCFFDAPVGMFITIDREMGPPQYSDLGMFIQSAMLVARSHGLHTCAQEAWSMWGKTIREFVGYSDDEMIFCGLALGYADESAKVNDLVSERAGVDEFASFRGF